MSGSNQVSVENLSMLSDLGTSSQTASQFYIEETQGAHQSFKVRTDGNEGAAIEAFVDKINNLSTQVFAVYPGLLSDFGTAVSNYSGALSDEGFSSKVYTDEGDISSIKTWLEVQRSNSIKDKGTILDMVFGMASDVLALSPNAMELHEDTKELVTNGLSKLYRQSRDYTTKHTALTTAKSTFASDIATVKDGLTQVKLYLNNALYLAQVEPSTLINWVKSGQLTEGNMDYLDSVQDKHDFDILKNLVSKDSLSEQMDALGQVDPSRVSQAMMNHVYVKNFQLLDNYIATGDEESLAAIGVFLASITGNNHSRSYVNTYMTKLSAGGVIFATSIQEKATSLMPNLSDYGEDYDRYMTDFNNAKAFISDHLSPRMATAQKVSGLFDTIRLAGFGKEEKALSLNMGKDKWVTAEQKIFDKDSLRYNRGDGVNGNLVFNFKDNTIYGRQGNNIDEIDTETKSVLRTMNTNFFGDTTTIAGAQAIDNINELKEEREQAVKGFWKDMAKTTASYLLPPGYSTVASVVLDLTEVDTVSDYGGILNKASSLYNGKYKQGFGTSKDVLSRMIGLQSELNRIDGDIKDAETKSHAYLFDAGGATYKDGRTISGFYQTEYDLQSVLYADDLEKNGMRGFALRDAANQGQTGDGLAKSVKAFEDQVKASSYSSSEKAFLKGEGETSLKDMGTPKVYDILTDMDNEGYQLGHKYEDYHNAAVKEFDAFVLGDSAS